MALAIFEGLWDRLKPDPIDIDNWNFKLHSKFSVGIFISASAVSILTSYFGSEIKCFGSNNDFVELNCWLHGSYHIEDTNLDFAINRGDSCFSLTSNQILAKGEQDGDSGRSDTSYYIWVSWMLLINAALFILPNQIWRYLEGGMMQKFNLNKDQDQKEESEDKDIEATDSKSKGAKLNAEKFTKVSLTAKRTYFWKFFAVECLNLTIAVINFFAIDLFLDGKFHGYGIDVFNYLTDNKYQTEIQLSSQTREEPINPMCNLFPTTVSCPTKIGSVSKGNVDTKSDLCLLSQNIVNQVIYTILWYWFMILFISNGIMLIYRIITITNIADARRTNLRYLMKTSNDEKDAMTRLASNPKKHKLEIGEWFLLSQIGQNCNHHYFRDVMEIVVKLRNESSGIEMSTGETTPMNVENQQINTPTNQNGITEDDESSYTKKTTLMNGEVTHMNGENEQINTTTNENGNTEDDESPNT